MDGRRLTCLFLLALFVCCHAGRREASRPAVPSESAPITDKDVVAYAELCKEELGIREALPDLNCLDGVEVPITINGQQVSAKDLDILSRGKGIGCDRAQWLDGECWTYDLIQRVEINDDVEAVLNCRQKLYTDVLSSKERIRRYEQAVAENASPDERVRLWRAIYEFDDLGLILRNRNTGKTCFFTFFGKLDANNVERSYSFYGGWVPAPDREMLASREDVFDRLPEPKPPEEYPERMWFRGPRGAPGAKTNMFFTPYATAKGQCVSCHNHGAFKHSPFIDQVYVDGERVVPSNDRDVPYLPVGHAFQENFREAGIVEIDTEPVAGVVQACTVCHRLTTGGRGAMKRLNWAVGEEVPHTSYTAGKFPHRAWMPSEHAVASEDDYHAAFAPMVKAIRCCAETPNAIGCRYRSIGPTEEDVELDERGLLSERGWIRGSDQSIPACVPERRGES